MAGFNHGIYVSEQGTELISLTEQAGGVTYAIGTAPIRKATSPALANEPVLCTGYADAAAAFGYDEDYKKYTLCEVMKVLFGLYNVSPIVMVNVFDPSKHRKTVTRELKMATAEHKIELAGDILSGTIKVESKSEEEEEEVYTEIELEKIEYTTEKTTLTLPATYGMGAMLYVTYAVPDVTAVSVTDVVGAVDATTGKVTGLETVNEVYARFGYTIGQIIAPGFSHNASVGQKMAAKAELINGHFSAIAIADIDTAQATGYALAGQVKTASGLESPYLIACYPALKAGEEVHHLSTHVAGIMSKQAAQNNDIPYKSPSNQYVMANGLCTFEGESNYFGLEAANALNGQGIMTVTNFNGFRTWGNETSAYPSSTDPKDYWIVARRMFNFIKTRLTLSFWSQLDSPIYRRTIDSVVNSANTYLNGLVNIGALLGGRVEFNESENSEEALMRGQVNFHCYITPPSPAEVINFVLEYDATYLSNVLRG